MEYSSLNFEENSSIKNFNKSVLLCLGFNNLLILVIFSCTIYYVFNIKSNLEPIVSRTYTLLGTTEETLIVFKSFLQNISLCTKEIERICSSMP